MKRLGCSICVLIVLLYSSLDSAWAGPPTFSLRRANLEGAYPGDFNGDGISDLATAARGGGGEPIPAVVLGRGDGTFGAPIKIPFAVGRPFGTGDFNNDGRLDLIAFNTPGAPDEDVTVYAGRGDGTFDGGHSTGMTLYLLRFVLSADFDNDGNRDIAAAENAEDGSDRLVVFRGRGDLTFDAAPAILTAAPELTNGVAIDLNGDGLRDIAVTNYEEHNVTVYLNRGSLVFSTTVVPGPFNANGITAADVTGDGKRDLIVASASFGSSGGPGYGDGAVSVLPGNGDGTFGAAVRYQVIRGAYSVVVTDVTRDGILDIVTANRSSIAVDDCGGETLKTWDSISVLTGAGNGTFSGPDNFSIGNQLAPPTDRRDRNTVSSVLTSDVNGDGNTDLITSGGAIFVNQPADPNWAPSVNLGPDQTYRGLTQVVLNAAANDVDQDLLAYSWTTDDGSVLPAIPNPCVSGRGYGTFHYTVTVYDGHGHTASDTVAVTFLDPAQFESSITIQSPAANETISANSDFPLRWHVHNPTGLIFTIKAYYSLDGGATYTLASGCEHVSTSLTADEDMSCVWRVPNQLSNNARILINGVDDDDMYVTGAVVGPVTIAAASTLPAPWATQDIGAVGAAGSVDYSNGVFTVRGSGADIWGNADEFRYVYQPSGGELRQYEIVTRVGGVENVNAWSKAGLMFRHSLDANTTHASLFVTPGKGIAFQRRASATGPSVSTAGPAITAPVWLRLTLNNETTCRTICTRDFIVRAYYRRNTTDPWTFVGEQHFGDQPMAYSGLAVTSHADGTTAWATFSEVATHDLPAWTTGTIGAASGSATVGDTTATVQASGADIWGTEDAFEYVYKRGGSSITARVGSVTNTNAWTKAGVMFRDSVFADSAHVMVMVTPGKGIAMQYRSVRGGASAQVAQVPGTAPRWVRLTRSGTTYTGAYSSDGSTWTVLGSVDISMPGTAPLAGLAVTSHATATATAAFDNVTVAP